MKLRTYLDTEPRELEAPSWADVESAISRLDALISTEVDIVAAQVGNDDGPPFMLVGGGAGNYLVDVTFDGITNYHLVNPASTVELVRMYVGGQQGEFAGSDCVDLETALRVVSTFFYHQVLDQSVTWLP